MRIYLVGLSCVGKSTLGKLLAEEYNYKFFDFDFLVMDIYKKNIDKIKADFNPPLLDSEYQTLVSPILEELLDNEKKDIVLAMPPSGLFPAYAKILEKHSDILTIELRDNIKAIIKRLIYFDDARKSWPITINDENRNYYLNEIKEDIIYYKHANKAAKLKVHLSGKNIDGALDILDLSIKKWLRKSINV